MANRCFLCKRAEETCNHLLLWWPGDSEISSMGHGFGGGKLGSCWFCSG